MPAHTEQKCGIEKQYNNGQYKNELNVPSYVPSYVPSNVPGNVPGKLPDLSRISLRLSLAIPTMTDTNQGKALTMILALADGAMSMQTLMTLVGDSNRSRVRKNIVTPLIREGFIAPAMAESLSSPTQTYQLTELSRSLLKTPDYITDPQSLSIQ